MQVKVRLQLFERQLQHCVVAAYSRSTYPVDLPG
eukprot:SAG31_NODE_27642_length_422_cov_1.510836_2_plen_33_part_01